MQSYVLTGATGFVGSQILRELTNRSINVRVIVRDRKKLPKLEQTKYVDVFDVDDLFTKETKKLKELLDGTDTLIHAAWYTEPGKYLTTADNLSCLEGTIRLAQAFFHAGGSRFVGLGTCAEYEHTDRLITVDTPLKPTTLYAACKASAYQVLSHYFSSVGVSFAWCRLFYLYGEGEDYRRLVPYIRRQLQAGQEALLTTGNQVRDFIDVLDAARMIVDIAIGSKKGAANICRGTTKTVRELAESIADEYGRRDLLKFGVKPENLFDPPRVVGVPGPFNA